MAPRLRDDLVAATVNDAEVTYVDLTDPASGANYRFYDFEYDLAKQLPGQPLEDVVAWASATYQLDLTTEALDQFIEKLAGLGFLASDGGDAHPQAISRTPSSSSGPFEKPAPSVVAARPEEVVESASSPMFGEGIGEAARQAIGAALAAIGDTTAAPGSPAQPVEPEMELSASALLEAGVSAPHPMAPFPLATPMAAAATPAALAEDHATEFQLKEPATGATSELRAGKHGNEDDKSGLFAKPRTLHGISLAPLTPLTPLAAASAPPLPRLQATAPPLPPLTSEAIGAGTPRRTSTVAAQGA